MQKIIIVALLAVTLCNYSLKRQIDIANYVNKAKSTWTAHVPDKDYTPLIGAILGHNDLPVKNAVPRNDLPDSFDLREKYANCESLKEIRDQANCGSCWAFGAAEVMSDRICIATNGTLQTRASPQALLTCCTSCGFGCNGGYPSAAFSYWKSKGVPTGGLYGDTQTCQPYFLPSCQHHGQGSGEPCPATVDTPECKKTCQDGYPKTFDEDLTFGSSAYSVQDSEEAIMTEIYDNGSVEAAFEVYEDFMNYKSGVYRYLTGSYLGGHAIKLIGWGYDEEAKAKYWIAVNSWNDGWGEKGTFRILKGEDECGIESEIVAGTPKIDTYFLE